MRKFRVRLLSLLLFCFWCKNMNAQSNCVPTNNNNAIFNFSCGINCDTVSLQVPHLKSTGDYSVVTIPYNPFPYVNTGATELTSIYTDDVYSELISMPFTFCFYDSVYSKCVIGSNGLITFDETNANTANAWSLTTAGANGSPIPIPYAGGIQDNAGSTYYPKASIMGAYHDIDPSHNPTGQRKIEYTIVGTAPCRKFVVSFFTVSMFSNACQNNLFCTQQIVLHESTGIIDVYFGNKPICNNWMQGLAILGVQNWNRNLGVAAPGKNCTQWSSQNEGYRFVPNGGLSRFVSSQLLTFGGTVLATADTFTTTPGLLDIRFPNVCPSSNSEQFIVRTMYSSCSDPNTFLISDDTITVNKTSSLNAIPSVSDVNCSNSTSGSIIVNVQAGTGVPPYQYSINGGPLQGSNIFSVLPAGVYTVFVTDPTGCSQTMNVTIGLTGTLTANIDTNSTSCPGVNNGSIIVTPTSGFAPYQYSINGSLPQNNNTFTNLAPGTYTISVKDTMGCTVTLQAVIAQGAGLVANATATNTACAGANNGTITVNASNGVPPYQYSLNGGPLQSGNIFTSLTAGTYNITVMDAAGCTVANLYATVNAGVPLNASLTKTDVSCNGGNDGSITINISNGVAPYQYSLDNVNWQASNTFTGLAAGTYTVYYRDNNTCSGSQVITIAQPALLNVNSSVQPVLCFGQSNGIITITASGGISPYQYSLDGINYQSSNTFSVPAGSFTVYIKDNNACIITRVVNVTEPGLLTLTLGMQNASCNGGPDGKITATAGGGSGGFQYSIDGVNFQSSNIFNVLPGNYTVTVRDMNNCTVAQSIAVGLTSNLTLIPAPDTIICEGSSVQLQVISNAVQYAWSPAASLSNAAISNPVASPSGTTTYIVTATLGQCSTTDTIVVNVNPAPVPDAGPDGDICYGQSYRLQGTGGVQYQWSPSSYLDNISIFDPNATPAQTITYNLSVVDAIGCASITTDQVTVYVTPPIIVNTSPKDTIVYAGDQFQLFASSIGTSYSWTPSTGLSNSNIPDPILTVSKDVTFKVTATTSAGCQGEGIVNIKVYGGPDIYVPTGFTPNGDGRNDIFKPIPIGVTELKYFRVYNRWGQLVFSTSKLNDGWDGTIGGMKQASGTFVWMVQGITRSGKLISKRGTVVLIR